MDSHRKGVATEAAVIARLTRRGIPVSIPFGDNERYDAIVETPDGRPLRIQIKTANYSDGVVDISGKSQHTNSQGHKYKRYRGDIDYFLGYSSDLDKMYLLPEGAIKSRVSLRVDEPKQSHGTINWAETYEFDEQWPPDPAEDDRLARQTTRKKVLADLEALDIPAWFSKDSVPYTVIVERTNGELLRLRVRSVSLNDAGKLQLNATNSTDRERLDYFLVYCHDLGQSYLVGADEFEKTIKLRVEDTDHQKGIVNWAEEYELEQRQSELCEP
jgi:hypothetical protein